MQAQIKTMRDDFAKLKVSEARDGNGSATSVTSWENWLSWTCSFINGPQHRRLASNLLTINIEGYNFISWT